MSTERGSDSDDYEEIIEDEPDTEVDEEVYEEMEDEMEEKEDESDSEGEEDEMEEDGPLTLSDPNLLDCPICMKPLSIPVHQCENGHVSCASCCLEMDNKCPSCSSEIGHNQCHFVEKLLESVTAPCRHKKYGCEEVLKCCNKREHEKICPLSPCSCPVTDCNFEGTMAGLYSHFSRSHIFATEIFSYNNYNPIELEKTQRHLIFCGEDNSIFVLNKFSEVKGSAINVVRIAPLDSDTLSYEITASYEQTSITLRSSIENILKWDQDYQPERNYLFVPGYCTTSEGQLRLELCIERTQQSPVTHPG